MSNESTQLHEVDSKVQNPFRPEFHSNPYPAYRTLRESAPIWCIRPGRWFVSSYEDSLAILRDSRFGTDGEVAAILANEPTMQSISRSMMMKDPPEHTQIRSVLTRALSPRATNALRQRAEQIAQESIDALLNRRSMDVIADYAYRLAATLTCDLLGVPLSERPILLTESKGRGRIYDPVALNRAELDSINSYSAEMQAYWMHVLKLKRQRPGQDLITALLAAQHSDSTVSDDVIVSNLEMLFEAGHGSTANIIGTGLLALHRNPEQLLVLKRTPTLLPTAIEELLRYDAPLQLTGRVALEDVVIRGHEFKQGDAVLIILGSANRDPKAYPEQDPEQLHLARRGVRNLSFGGGIHACLGPLLGRIEALAAFRCLLERLPGLRLVELEDVRWKPTIVIRGLTELHATW